MTDHHNNTAAAASKPAGRQLRYPLAVGAEAPGDLLDAKGLRVAEAHEPLPLHRLPPVYSRDVARELAEDANLGHLVRRGGRAVGLSLPLARQGDKLYRADGSLQAMVCGTVDAVRLEAAGNLLGLAVGAMLLVRGAAALAHDAARGRGKYAAVPPHQRPAAVERVLSDVLAATEGLAGLCDGLDGNELGRDLEAVLRGVVHGQALPPLPPAGEPEAAHGAAEPGDEAMRQLHETDR
jgi:hypothetical protein